MNMNIQELEKIGLADKKAKVYLAILALGRATIIQIAKRTLIKRTTVYDIVLDLMNQGFISEIKNGAKTLLIAEDPTTLVSSFESKLEEIKTIVPALSEIYFKSISKPALRFYEGISGIRHLMEESLKMKSKEQYYWGAVGDLTKIFGDIYVKKYAKRRASRSIWSYCLTTNTTKTPNFIVSDNKALRKVRRLSSNMIFNGVLCIYDNKVMYISSPDELFGFVIESNSFSSLIKTLFRSMWETARD